ncbi:hypothetical protein MML48_4g00013483 [Holotrichia oblita]|uniref:Uncharacterized protein n=1 Tax=Holotrichia oblita TaxID=644536 RepID=A0ACB9T6K8_HOLOL|nr:hypothetical protein MML48_4g00013483 [Holotrichia oblita]
MHRTVYEITLCLENHLSDIYIYFPTIEQEKLQKKVTFLNRWGIGGVIGAVDCTYIAILCPQDEGHNYMNRKGYYSKNVQIICDADLKIMSINAQHAGGTHDAFIWRHSGVHQLLKQNYLRGERNIGDSGYPLQPYLLTPVPDVQPNSPEERFNRAHSSARNCVERCIGTLKTRFRCLLLQSTVYGY